MDTLDSLTLCFVSSPPKKSSDIFSGLPKLEDIIYIDNDSFHNPERFVDVARFSDFRVRGIPRIL